MITLPCLCRYAILLLKLCAQAGTPLADLPFMNTFLDLPAFFIVIRVHGSHGAIYLALQKAYFLPLHVHIWSNLMDCSFLWMKTGNPVWARIYAHDLGLGCVFVAHRWCPLQANLHKPALLAIKGTTYDTAILYPFVDRKVWLFV